MKKHFLLYVMLLFTTTCLVACGLNKSGSKDVADASSEENSSTSFEAASSVHSSEADTSASVAANHLHTVSISSGAVADATLDSPANIGEWIESMRFSAVDDAYHTIYYRITEVEYATKSENVLTTLKAYNDENHVVSFRLNNNKTLEYGLIHYEVAFPKDFPEGDQGLVAVDIPLKLVNASGENYYYEKNDQHYDQSLVTDITVKPAEHAVHAGNTFTDGVAVFEIPIESRDFIISNTFYLANNAFSTYVKIK